MCEKGWRCCQSASCSELVGDAANASGQLPIGSACEGVESGCTLLILRLKLHEGQLWDEGGQGVGTSGGRDAGGVTCLLCLCVLSASSVYLLSAYYLLVCELA